jgi:hypothetical protein
LSFSCPRARCPVGDSWRVCWVCAGFLVDEQKSCMTVFAQADGFVAPRLVAVPPRPRASDGRHARRHRQGDLRFLRRPRPSSLTRSDLLDAGPKVVCRPSHMPAWTPRIRRVTSPTGSSPTRARAGATTVPHSAARADVERVLVELRPNTFLVASGRVRVGDALNGRPAQPRPQRATLRVALRRDREWRASRPNGQLRRGERSRDRVSRAAFLAGS